MGHWPWVDRRSVRTPRGCRSFVGEATVRNGGRPRRAISAFSRDAAPAHNPPLVSSCTRCRLRQERLRNRVAAVLR